jgi:hypothetical protein
LRRAWAIAAVALVAGLVIGYVVHRPTTTVVRTVVPSPSPSPSPVATPFPVIGGTPTPEASPKSERKPGTITVKGSGPEIFGPYNLKPGGYTFSFEQMPDNLGFNKTSLVVSLESKPNKYNEPYQLLCNTSKRTGSNQVVVSGKLWVDVSSSANDFLMTFVPKHSH